MKKIKTLALVSFWGLSTIYAQNFEWVKKMGKTGDNIGHSIAVDALGNVYTIGTFQGTADFDPGTGISELTATAKYDYFVQKLDAKGNFVWAKKSGGIDYQYDKICSLALDAYGNVYTIGTFQGTADFDPSAGISNLTSNGYLDIFIQKLDANGNFIWVKQMGGTGNDYGRSIAVDASGNIYTTGNFVYDVDFDPGSGTSNLTSDRFNDIFVQKLDADGNFIWAKQMAGSFDNNGYSITVDAFGNIYTTGDFSGTTDFDPSIGISNLTSVNSSDIYVQKLNENGNFIWAKQMGGKGVDYGSDIAVDSSGNLYITGSFQDTADFDPGIGISNYIAVGYNDNFVQKLDSNGDFKWVKQVETTGEDYSRSIAVDALGNVYTTGFFRGTADFDPGIGINYLTTYLSTDLFVQKLDANGNFIWARQIGNQYYGTLGYSIALDAFGNIYTTGYFYGKIDFDPGSGTSYLTAVGRWDIFVHKMSQTIITGVAKDLDQSATVYNIYPNPSKNKTYIELGTTHSNVSIYISDLNGALVFYTTYQQTARIEISLEDLPSGVYLLTLQSESKSLHQKLVKE
jgi:hypothetical protein